MSKTTPTTTNNGALPPALTAAISGAEAALAKFDKLNAVLTETGASIPKSLASERELYGRLGGAEVNGDAVDHLRSQLDAVQAERQSATRKRRAAEAELVEMADDLAKVRGAVDQARAVYAAGVVSDFQRRWREACELLAALHSEGKQLSQTLQATVHCPPPYRPVLSVASDQWQVQLTAALPPAPALPPELATVAGACDRLTEAAGVIGGIRQASELNAKHTALARLRTGMNATMPGVYETRRSFDFCGSHFTPGTLVSRDLIPDGMLHRLQSGRTVALVDAMVASAA